MRDNPQSGPSNSTRRTFLLTTGNTAAATIVAAYAQAHANSTAGQGDSTAAGADGPNIESAVPIILHINGKDQQLRVDPRTTLLDCLRETVALSGMKKGCDQGQCGACTVHVNGRRVNSCLSLALMHDGEQIKYSGVGREYGRYGIEAFLETRAILE
jgi:xanthine dehydrogenase YagT iron-sulfur-binding subunit